MRRLVVGRKVKKVVLPRRKRPESLSADDSSVPWWWLCSSWNAVVKQRGSRMRKRVGHFSEEFYGNETGKLIESLADKSFYWKLSCFPENDWPFHDGILAVHQAGPVVWILSSQNFHRKETPKNIPQNFHQPRVIHPVNRDFHPTHKHVLLCEMINSDAFGPPPRQVARKINYWLTSSWEGGGKFRKTSTPIPHVWLSTITANVWKMGREIVFQLGADVVLLSMYVAGNSSCWLGLFHQHCFRNTSKLWQVNTRRTINIREGALLGLFAVIVGCWSFATALGVRITD